MIKAVLKEILKGKTLIRALMNLELQNYLLAGRVLDIGGGENPSYLRFFQKSAGLKFVSVDLKSLDNPSRLDLETEKLPCADGSVDQILLFNILEHVYNYKFLLAEVRRVLKPDGTVLGFVPFLVGFHPDPHDYFRYTKESLGRIFYDAGFQRIEVYSIGGGPLLVDFNVVMPYFPRILNVLLWPVVWLLDAILLFIKPSLREKFPLGYFFKCQL